MSLSVTRATPTSPSSPPLTAAATPSSSSSSSSHHHIHHQPVTTITPPTPPPPPATDGAPARGVVGLCVTAAGVYIGRGVCFDGWQPPHGVGVGGSHRLGVVRWTGFFTKKGVCWFYSKMGCLVSGLAAVRGRLVGWQPPRGALVGAVTAQGAFGWVAATTQPPYGVRLV
ncbi:hypothetical protein Tco_1125647 [Tanacetum coccineum]|uniref:Uncharacterized protein n=1 Tax=Tanacetum coccineum TaxID=301880 RepID=A0ABQ5J9J6_9ASTR